MWSCLAGALCGLWLLCGSSGIKGDRINGRCKPFIGEITSTDPNHWSYFLEDPMVDGRKFCTTWDVQTLTIIYNNGINYLSTGAGFLPSSLVDLWFKEPEGIKTIKAWNCILRSWGWNNARDKQCISGHFYKGHYITYLRAIKQCKCMVSLRDFCWNVHCVGW